MIFDTLKNMSWFTAIYIIVSLIVSFVIGLNSSKIYAFGSFIFFALLFLFLKYLKIDSNFLTNIYNNFSSYNYNIL